MRHRSGSLYFSTAKEQESQFIAYFLHSSFANLETEPRSGDAYVDQPLCRANREAVSEESARGKYPRRTGSCDRAEGKGLSR